MYFRTPLSKEGYLPTSPAPPTGAPADASTRGAKLGGKPFPADAPMAPGCYLLTQAGPGTGCSSSRNPTRAHCCSLTHPGLHSLSPPKRSIILTKNVWMHFQTPQQHNVQKPHSPPQKAGDLIYRRLVQKCKPHHPIKQITYYHFVWLHSSTIFLSFRQQYPHCVFTH